MGAMACLRQLRKTAIPARIDHGTISNTSPQSSSNDDRLSSKDVWFAVFELLPVRQQTIETHAHGSTN